MSSPYLPASRAGQPLASYPLQNLGPWPELPRGSADWSRPMMTTFLERLNYCRRLAAQKGRLPSLGAGYRAIMIARFVPLFYKDPFGSDSQRAADCRRFVLQDLREVRMHLENLGHPVEGTRGALAARLLADLNPYALQDAATSQHASLPIYSGRLRLQNEGRSLEHAGGHFLSLLYELGSMTAHEPPLEQDVTAALAKWDPLAVLYHALAGWRFLVAAAFGSLFRHGGHDDTRRQHIAEKLNRKLLLLLDRVYQIYAGREDGAEIAMLEICLHSPAKLAQHLEIHVAHPSHYSLSAPIDIARDISLYERVTGPDPPAWVGEMRRRVESFRPRNLAPLPN